MKILNKANERKDIKLEQLPPLALYIHIPWCIKKCPYCDFNSHTSPSGLPEEGYIDCLIKDLENAVPLIWGRNVYSIFIGGGTPSLFSGKSIDRLLTTIRSLISVSPYAEITIEANPGATDNENIFDYYNAGVNRISFGVQSFNDSHLKSLGRIHDKKAAISAVEIAKKYFQQINMDLMYGLPNQSLEELKLDLNQAINLDTSHLSYYNLTIEPNTEFYKMVPKNLPDSDLCFVMQETINSYLSNFSFIHYETSAYAKKQSYCQHNLNYWQFGDYLGIGAGAHSKISFHDKIIRQVRQKHPRNYMLSNMNISEHIIEDRVTNASELPFEFMLNALRLIDGFPATLFTERTGLTLNAVLPKLQSAIEKGLIQMANNKIIPTKKGQDFLNDLLMLFL